MEDILIGTADRTILVFIPDPASTTGAGKTGLAAAAITVTYTRVETDNDVVHTDVTSSLNDLSALTDSHNDWGWKEVNSTLSKGLYRLDIADAVFASGAWYAVVQVTITSGTAAATPKGFRLVARNDLDGVRLGLTALPNAAADAAGGLPISDAGGLDLDTFLGRITGNVALASVLGALNDAAVDGDPTTTDTLMQYIKQLVNTLVGTTGIPTFPAAAAPGNAVSLSEAIRQIYTDVAAIGGGTVAADVTAIKAKTDNLPSDPADQSLVIAATTAIYDRLGAPAGASMSADIAAIATTGADVEAALEDMFESTTTPPPQGTPPTDADILYMIRFLYKLGISLITQDANWIRVFAANGTTVDHKAPTSDDGTTYTRGKFVSGP